eukprot:g41073.t1
MEVDVMEDLQEVKSQQALVFALEASEIIFWSLVFSVEQDKMSLRFFLQKMHKQKSALSSLKEEDGSVSSSQSARHPEDQYCQTISLPAELYSALWDLIGQDLLKGVQQYASGSVVKDGSGLVATEPPSSKTVPYYKSFVEKFAKKNTFGQKSIKKWSIRSVLKTLRKKERLDPVGLFPEQTVKVIWQNASLPELSNKHHATAWLVVRKALRVKSSMYAWTLCPIARCPRSGYR